MFIQKLTFKNSRNLTLPAIFEGEDREAPVVVICHGYGSSKDSISYKNLVPKLLNRGLSVFRFDFSGCGQSEGNLVDLTPLAGLDDLKSAVKNFDLTNFGLCGTSFGGYVALLYTFENIISALALRAPVSDWQKIIFEHTEHVKEIRDRILNEVGEIDIYQKTKSLTLPSLIVHGDKDDVVPLEQSRRLYEAIKGDKRLEILHGVDHDIKNNPEHLETSNNLIADFFQKHLLWQI